MPDLIRVARKELWAFFSSPVAYIFLGAFLAVSLFVFFWVETFFARNIADVRPLFEWMPLLLIFLVAALTMRLWSEERRAGTLETLMTLPASAAARARQIPGQSGAGGRGPAADPASAGDRRLLGPLDWGPVVGGYIAALLLAAAYISIGLFVWARTDNHRQPHRHGSGVRRLLSARLGCLDRAVRQRGGEMLRLLGTGSRFESIARGVIDLRDIYYYLSIFGVFLALNVYALESLRWSARGREQEAGPPALGAGAAVRRQFLVAGNLWLGQIGWARADLTDGTRVFDLGRDPALSAAVAGAAADPRLFQRQDASSAVPLVPRLRDLLKEYEMAGHGKVRVEFVDPTRKPAIEAEANQQYGIRPVPFQSASKYQTSVINSYFNILVKYGDEFTKLGFRT